MIFQRSILREKITLTAVIFFTLFTILTVFFLVRSLNDVTQGLEVAPVEYRILAEGAEIEAAPAS